MSSLDSHLIGCPYCGEQIEISIEPSAGDQDYIEDCHVCCRPINISIKIDRDGDYSVTARSDNE